MFLERETIQTEISDAIKIHILFSTYISFFFPENLALYETMRRYMTDSNNITRRMRTAGGITKARKSTLRISNNCFFSCSTIFLRTRPNVKLHLKCLSCHTLTRQDTTPLCFMSHQKWIIPYGCGQLYSIFLWFSKLKITSWWFCNWDIQIFA